MSSASNSDSGYSWIRPTVTATSSELRSNDLGQLMYRAKSRQENENLHSEIKSVVTKQQFMPGTSTEDKLAQIQEAVCRVLGNFGTGN
jgi:hypothetical protein